jgi:hypothetical protein
MFVMLFDKGLVGTTRYQDVGAEGVDPECVLERVPRRIVWFAVGNLTDAADALKAAMKEDV